MGFSFFSSSPFPIKKCMRRGSKKVSAVMAPPQSQRPPSTTGSVGFLPPLAPLFLESCFSFMGSHVMLFSFPLGGFGRILGENRYDDDGEDLGEGVREVPIESGR